jgi:hypothetical protein
LFIRCLLVGVREGLGVGISLSYKWKQIGIFFRRIVCVYELFSTRNEPYNGIINQGLYNLFAIIGPSLFTVDIVDDLLLYYTLHPTTKVAIFRPV